MKRVVSNLAQDKESVSTARNKKLVADTSRKKPQSKISDINFAEMQDPSFSAAVISWQKQHGRHALPWQNTRDPYRVWLSEIMLQQTQVTAVIPYYLRFLQTFPNVQSLATASSEQVMSHWSGLGYYSRARNLHKCAQLVVSEHHGIFPADPVLLEQLPGIGRSTAAAIAAFSYGARAAILDGNVKRVFARVFGIDRYPGEKAVENEMWLRALALLPEQDRESAIETRIGFGDEAGVESSIESDIGAGIEAGIEAYTQGLMDLGATLCTRSRPACERCPLSARCVAYATGRTAELPVRKPEKVIPEKYAVMLIVLDGEQVLLEQRPNYGIWGGLLSLPQISVDDHPAASELGLAQQLQKNMLLALAPFGEIAAIESLSAVAHGFTHFKLHIAPYRIRLKQRLQRHQMVAQSSQVWYPTKDLADAPLPAPVKKLLLSLC